MPTKTPLIVGNWKMHGRSSDLAQVKALCDQLTREPVSAQVASAPLWLVLVALTACHAPRHLPPQHEPVASAPLHPTTPPLTGVNATPAQRRSN